MSTICTVGEWRQYMTQVPASTEIDALIQVALDRAEATILRQLTGVTIELPAPEDLKQIVLEVTTGYYQTRGVVPGTQTMGPDGVVTLIPAGGLTGEHKKALRQIRIELGGIAV
jgi:vacuolar-type H+-ATPase catalytic subunit A/Vma1